MTDSERILEIIKTKGLSNVQFCNQTGISQASLSHIASGRSNPTLATLRSVMAGFPDLNPEWVMMGTGEMFRTEGESVANGGEKMTNIDAAATPSSQPMAEADTTAGQGLFGQTANPGQLGFEWSPNASAPRAPKSQPVVQPATIVDIPAVVRETIKQLHRPQRKIIEVRIFFDDGTYESFGSSK